jgi:hypothetical protein
MRNSSFVVDDPATDTVPLLGVSSAVVPDDGEVVAGER